MDVGERDVAFESEGDAVAVAGDVDVGVGQRRGRWAMSQGTAAAGGHAGECGDVVGPGRTVVVARGDVLVLAVAEGDMQRSSGTEVMACIRRC